MRRATWVGVVAAVAVLASCSAGGDASDGPGACATAEGTRSVSRTGEPSPPEDLLQWSGFEDIAGLTVIDADEECGLDALVRIALQGEPAAVDAALLAADFDEPPSPGSSVVQAPLDGVQLADLTDVASSTQQRWENSAGDQLTRLYVRGRMGTGNQEVLHIWAFTK